MADIIDEANDLNELRLTTALANRPSKPKSLTGFCIWCRDEPVMPAARTAQKSAATMTHRTSAKRIGGTDADPCTLSVDCRLSLRRTEQKRRYPRRHSRRDALFHILAACRRVLSFIPDRQQSFRRRVITPLSPLQSTRQPYRPTAATCRDAAQRIPLCCTRHGRLLFVGQTLLYPVGIKPSLMQQRTGRPAQVMYRQRFKVNSLLIYPLNHTINHIIQRCIRQRLTDVIAPGIRYSLPMAQT